MERKMKMVRNTTNIYEYDQGEKDMEYWLTKSPKERLEAVTFLVNQRLTIGQRMDRSYGITIKSRK